MLHIKLLNVTHANEERGRQRETDLGSISCVHPVADVTSTTEADCRRSLGVSEKKFYSQNTNSIICNGRQETCVCVSSVKGLAYAETRLACNLYEIHLETPFTSLPTVCKGKCYKTPSVNIAVQESYSSS